MIILSLVTTICFGQQGSFDFKNLKFSGLEFTTTEQAIVKSLGQGQKVHTDEDEYPCGPFSGESEEAYYQIIYEGFNFIGNDKHTFFLENVNFDMNGKIKITYKDKLLSGLTTKADFYKIFDNVAKEYFNYPDPNQDTVIIYTNFSETGAQFTFKNSRLVRFHYWYLC